jgi:hypothetical protein
VSPDAIAGVLEEIRARFGLTWCIAIASDGAECATAGDAGELPYSGLLATLFGTPELRLRWFGIARLDGNPEFWGQGKTYCVIVRPREDPVVGYAGVKGDRFGEIEQQPEILAALQSALRNLDS